MAYSADTFVADEQPTTAKWNKLWTNDASFNDGTGIAASAITPEKLLASTGTSWPYIAWTPSWTNLTVGNGSVSAFYKQIGKTIFGSLAFTMGSTSSVSGSVSFSLPVTAASRYTGSAAGQYRIGGFYLEDLAVAGYTGYFRAASITTAQLIVEVASTAYVSASTLNATIPFTIATGDFFCGEFCYEAA